MSTLKQKNNWITLILIILILTLISGISFFKIIKKGLSLSPDSYIYLDTSQNIYHGRGIVHSFILSSELEHWNGETSYIPVSYWAPGFPVYIYLIKTMVPNIPFTIASAIAVWVSFILTIITITLLLTRIYNFRTGLWGILLISLFYPIIYTYSWVWSDGIVIPFMLLTLWFITENQNPNYKKLLFLAGINAGIAFSIRYIQGILLPYGFLLIFSLGLISSKNHSFKTKMINITLNEFTYIFGWACISAPVLIRNIIATGTIMGNSRPLNHIPVLHNLQFALLSLIKECFPPNIIPSEIQGSLLLSFFLICLLVFLIRRKNISIRSFFCNRFCVMLTTWGLFYFTVVSLYASLYQIDILGHRLLLPFTVVMLIRVSILCDKIMALPSGAITIGAIISIFLFSFIYPCNNDFFYTTTTLSRNNVRGAWVCSNTQPGDWIMGDSTFDLSVMCDNRRSLCFVPGSVRDTPPGPKEFDTFLNKIPPTTSRIFIILRKGIPFENIYHERWIEFYGEVITELFFNRKYENLVAVSVYSEKGFLSAEIQLHEK